jgi:hypothetical protein
VQRSCGFLSDRFDRSRVRLLWRKFPSERKKESKKAASTELDANHSLKRNPPTQRPHHEQACPLVRRGDGGHHDRRIPSKDMRSPLWSDPHGPNVRKEEAARQAAVDQAARGERKQ